MTDCSAESHTSSEALGDEVAIGVETYGLDWGSPAEMLPVVLRLARRGEGPVMGLLSMARAMSKLPQMVQVARAHCEVAVHLERFGFDASVRAALFQAFERWDGSGKPKGNRARTSPSACGSRTSRSTPTSGTVSAGWAAP